MSNRIRNRFISNGLWLYILQFFNMILPLMTLPYITRVLGSSQYGVFSIVLNIVTYLQTVVEYGFTLSGSRYIAINGLKQLSMKFTRVFLSRFILTIICIGVGTPYFFLNLNNIHLSLSFLILLFGLFGYCFQMNWLYQGLQEVKYLSMISIVVRLFTTILTFLLVASSSDLIIYCILYALSPLLVGFISFYLAKQRYKISFTSVKLSDVWIELNESFHIFTTQMSGKVFGAIGITILGLVATHQEVGIFSAIQKIPQIIILMWSPIEQLLYPISSQKFHESFNVGQAFVSKTKKMVFPIFSLLVFGIIIFSRPLVMIIFGEGYVGSHYLLWPLAVWILVAIDNNFSGVQTLLACGKDNTYSKVFQLSVIVTIVLNLSLIYVFKGAGAAFAPLLSEIFLNILLRHEIRKLHK